MKLDQGSLEHGLAIAGLLLFASAGEASIVTQTEGISLSVPPLVAEVVNDNGAVTKTGSPLGSTSATLTFSQFNAALGTLTGVSYSFISTFGGTATVSASPVGVGNSAQPVNYFAEDTVTRQLSGLSGAINLSSSTAFQATCNPGGNTSCSGSQTPSGSFDQATTSLAPLSNFIGNGTFDLSASMDWTALSLRVNPDNGTGYADNTTIDGTLASNWNGTVTVTYTYDPNAANGTPEPASLYLVGAALAAAGWGWRRKPARKA